MMRNETNAKSSAVNRMAAGDSLPYLGQTPPGKTPVMFAEGIISKGDAHGRLVISPDGREMFWTTFSVAAEGVAGARILHVVDENGKWTEPQIPTFLVGGMTSGCMFSPDGRKLFYSHTEDVDQGWETHYVEKTDSGWSTPKSDGFIPKPTASFTRSGMAYFSASLTGKPWNSGIFCARYSDDGYADVQALDDGINSRYIDYTPFVSPEGDYLIFSSSRPSMDEDMFLHICFRSGDGTWSMPQRMNEKMGFSGRARFPSISPDGRYIFFCGDDGNIYWIDRAIVDRFKS